MCWLLFVYYLLNDRNMLEELNFFSEIVTRVFLFVNAIWVTLNWKKFPFHMKWVTAGLSEVNRLLRAIGMSSKVIEIVRDLATSDKRSWLTSHGILDAKHVVSTPSTPCLHTGIQLQFAEKKWDTKLIHRFIWHR